MSEHTAAEITITRIITEEGRMAVKVRTPNSYNSVELLGMLEVARLQIYQEMGQVDED